MRARKLCAPNPSPPPSKLDASCGASHLRRAQGAVLILRNKQSGMVVSRRTTPYGLLVAEVQHLCCVWPGQEAMLEERRKLEEAIAKELKGKAAAAETPPQLPGQAQPGGKEPGPSGSGGGGDGPSGRTPREERKGTPPETGWTRWTRS